MKRISVSFLFGNNCIHLCFIFILFITVYTLSVGLDQGFPNSSWVFFLVFVPDLLNTFPKGRYNPLLKIMIKMLLVCLFLSNTTQVFYLCLLDCVFVRIYWLYHTFPGVIVLFMNNSKVSFFVFSDLIVLNLFSIST